MAASFCGISIGLAMSIAMTVVGSTYSDCNLYVLLWLKVSGGVGIGINILSILMSCCRCSRNNGQQDPFTSCLNIIIACTALSLVIWGSAVTFGPYSSWTYDHEDIHEPTYCNYAPYMFAFVTLVVFWCDLAITSAVCFYCGWWKSAIPTIMGYEEMEELAPYNHIQQSTFVE